MAASRRPNLLFIMSDDHAAHAISAYDDRLTTTPHLDRLATDGMRFDAAFCTNSICTPSRAAILTGTYNHVNGVTTLDTPLDNTLWNVPTALRDAGYRTSIVGKWHLGHGPHHDPTGFDEWRVLPGQGHYHNPVMLEAGGRVVERGGYVTDLITDDTIAAIDRWADARAAGDLGTDAPFAVFCHHKAPHRTWEPAPEFFDLYDDVEIPEPETFHDTLEGRAEVVQAVKMRMLDLDPITDLGAPVPDGLDLEAEISWRYQRYIKRYLRTIASIDKGVGRLLDHLESIGELDDTVIVYTSDQGFFLGDHGWFDKRLMYEESLTMPLLVRYGREVRPGSVNDDLVVNVDLGVTLLDLAGIAPPEHVQGRSIAPLLRGERPDDWRTAAYHRYWMHHDRNHDVPAHYGVRTRTHKLICYYNDPLGQLGANGPVEPPEVELFCLESDPYEVDNRIADPELRPVLADLVAELRRTQAEIGDEPYPAVETLLDELLG